jgi:nucleoside-diphosphate-sugar epimerase
VYGFPDLAAKRAAGRVAEESRLDPVTMYGCNKLYCEHLGRYFTRYFRQLGALATAARMDFRALRFPGLISAETVPTGGTSDFGPEMLHAAAQKQPYQCFVGPEATIPFMAMPDAVTALVRLLEADRQKLRHTVYNVSAFSVSASEMAARANKAFPGAKIEFEPDAVRSRIVDSWPADMDDARARADWGWEPAYDVDRAFDEYLVPQIRRRYAPAR